MTQQELRRAKEQGADTVILNLTTNSTPAFASAVRQIASQGLRLCYWIEIGRCPELADAHPEWMASLQGHPEWRRFFPKFPKLAEHEVAKTHPWVPILYRETFAAHLSRVRELLAGKPAAQGIFLNDLQGAPSACGCGHPLCRWTGDYGPIQTATRLPDDAAAKFVAAVRTVAPGMDVIPVWTTECEEHDKPGLCAGVGCFKGTCWKALTTQLTPLLRECETVGALLCYKELQRDLPVYGKPAGWVAEALSLLQTMPGKHNGAGLPSNRTIAILQGWDVTDAEIDAQTARAREAGVRSVIVSRMKIDQSWKPFLFKSAPHPATSGSPSKN